MSIEPIGIATILIGIYCLILGSNATLIVLAVASIFGAAAAFTIGSANIQPAYVLLGFLAIGVITRPEQARAFIQSLRFGEPGFWLAGLVIYGVASAYFIPRLLEGATQIVPLGTTIYGDTRSTVPLVPVSSNLTQSIYIIGDLVCFAVTMAVASTYRGFNALVTGVLACCVMIVVFAFIDIFTFSTGTQSLLGFMRNAQYVLHFDDQVAGLRRIVGSFTETSQFARTVLGAIGFCGTLWLCGRFTYLAGTTALISLFLVVLSTSSTGLACTPIVLLLLYGTALSLSGRTKIRSTLTAATVFVPMMVIVAGLWVATDPVLSKIVYNYADKIVLAKASSDSGVERNSFNVYAYQNFIDSYGFGVGLGTARTSSIFVALLSNVGIPGIIFYLAFFYSTFIRPRGNTGSFAADIRLAARNGCLGFIFGDALGSPAIDQGVLFYIMAALAAAQPKRDAATSSADSLTSTAWTQLRTDLGMGYDVPGLQPRGWRFGLRSSTADYDGPFGLLRSTMTLVLKHKIKLAASVLAGLGIALIYANSLPRTYTANATLLLTTATATPQGFDSNRVDSELQKLMSERLVKVVFDALHVEGLPEFSKPVDELGGAPLSTDGLASVRHIEKFIRDLLSPGANALHPDTQPITLPQAAGDARQYALEAFMSRISARRLGQSYALEVSFFSTDPVFSARVANALASAYILQSIDSKLQDETARSETLRSRIAALTTQLDAAKKAVSEGTYPAGPVVDADARVVAAASIPQSPSAPRSWLIIALGGMSGLLIGSTIIAFGTAINRRVKTAEILSRDTGVECLGMVPDIADVKRSRLPWISRTNQSDQSSIFGLAMRDIRTKIDIACDPTRGRRPFVLAIASSGSPGRTSNLGSNLAGFIGRGGRQVTIFKTVSEDGGTSLDRTHSSEQNLADILVADKKCSEVVFEKDDHGTAVLAVQSTNPETNFFADFRDPRVGELVDIARGRGDVILELPPLGGSTDALALVAHADAVVVVVAHQRTTTQQAIETLQQFRRVGANIIGTVIVGRGYA